MASEQLSTLQSIVVIMVCDTALDIANSMHRPFSLTWVPLRPPQWIDPLGSMKTKAAPALITPRNLTMTHADFSKHKGTMSCDSMPKSTRRWTRRGDRSSSWLKAEGSVVCTYSGCIWLYIYLFLDQYVSALVHKGRLGFISGPFLLHVIRVRRNSSDMSVWRLWVSGQRCFIPQKRRHSIYSKLKRREGLLEWHVQFDCCCWVSGEGCFR